MSERKTNSAAWIDDEEVAQYPPLTRQQAQAFRERHPQVSVWWVIAAQAAVGGVVAALAWLISGDRAVMGSALFGAAVVVVPAALMARGATSGNSRASPLVGAVSFMSWAVVKIGFSVLMLLLAPKIVQPLSWPALLAAMVLCMQSYWLALLWRRR
jgi:ATP synthase protein I